MAQKTLTEKDMLLQTIERESQTTLKVLNAYPADKSDFRPAEKSRTAKELAWTFSMEQAVADMALKGKVDFSGPMPPPPATFREAVSAFEKTVRETMGKVAKADEAGLNRMVQMPMGPGKMGDVRAIDVLWMTLMDQVHHRGQFSVYLRLVGAKVPSIYGPTADETWM